MDYWLIVEVFKYVAFIVWTSYSINVVLGMIGRAIYKPKISNTKTNKLELVLVSVASKKVRNSLLETVNYTKSKFKGVPFSIVIDEGAELFDDLVQISRSPVMV